MEQTDKENTDGSDIQDSADRSFQQIVDRLRSDIEGRRHNSIVTPKGLYIKRSDRSSLHGRSTKAGRSLYRHHSDCRSQRLVVDWVTRTPFVFTNRTLERREFIVKGKECL
ncbi:hypothetical protein PoB_004205300 [Plakobranchus ocellatus]|uniref:Uncharacterized protein n=1 Tax=Plakobranchus ocellatus TaxID=259542 RepID=A0AAV4B7F7_9GAST|nr:hypothetical protein PoB_004205300 [Plakobranchus ocellatus]